ncbi:hypothetical protein FACHB389_21445 [Nostoc calcicola FACHB-389]|nr:hypothetical protein FACHB389_21445 [Nostoc calcicola FACHB-389]
MREMGRQGSKEQGAGSRGENIPLCPQCPALKGVGFLFGYEWTLSNRVLNVVQITKFSSWVGNQKLKFEFSTNVKTLFQPHFLNTYTCEPIHRGD